MFKKNWFAKKQKGFRYNLQLANGKVAMATINNILLRLLQMCVPHYRGNKHCGVVCSLSRRQIGQLWYLPPPKEERVVIVVRVAGWGGARARPMEELKIGHETKPVSKLSRRRARGESSRDAPTLFFKTLNAMPVLSRCASSYWKAFLSQWDSYDDSGFIGNYEGYLALRNSKRNLLY